nr:hypothetical protein [Saccharopolyspora sp. 6V]
MQLNAWCTPSEISPASWKDFGPRIAPSSTGSRCCTGVAKVNSPS